VVLLEARLAQTNDLLFLGFATHGLYCANLNKAILALHASSVHVSARSEDGAWPASLR
jgi:hypothetical protein